MNKEHSSVVHHSKHSWSSALISNNTMILPGKQTRASMETIGDDVKQNAPETEMASVTVC